MTGSDTERKSNSSLFHHAMMMMMMMMSGISENTVRTRNTVNVVSFYTSVFDTNYRDVVDC